MRIITLRFIASLVAVISTMTMRGEITAQQESLDSTLNIIAFFCKNDTMDYRYEYVKAKVTGNDTVINLHCLSDIRFIVRDSTSEGYEIESIPMGCEMYYGTDSLMNSIMNTLYEKMGDIHTIFTIDEYGTLQHIKNWKEIKDFSRSLVKHFCDSLYSAVPDLNEVIPRSRLEMFFGARFINEKKYMEEEDELQLLFSIFGTTFSIGKQNLETQSEAGYPEHIEFVAGYGPSSEEHGFEGDYFVSSVTTTTIPKDDVKAYANNAMGMLMSDKVVDSVAQEIDKLDVTDAEVKLCEDYVFFFNGWPCEMNYYKLTNVMNTKNIEIKNITWTSHSWNIYGFDTDDDTGISM